MSEDFLAKLNEEQRVAVTHVDGPLMIVAGAGTGKTTVVTHRIAWLIDQGHAKPEEILALTFTDKAAGEMEERVDRLLPYGYVDLQISTFHSFAEKLLRRYGVELGLSRDFRLMTELDAWLLARQYFDRFELDLYRPLGNPTKYIRSLLTHFSRAKDVGIDPADYGKFVEGKKADIDLLQADEAVTSEIAKLEELARAYATYQAILLEHDALDFGDLMLYTLKLLQTRPAVRDEIRTRFKFVLVDEFQDTNDAQYEIVKLIAEPRRNLTVVGDDDQCLPGDTMILTPKGEVPIKKINPGDEIISGVGKAHLGVSTVSHVAHSKKKTTLITFTTASGHSITTTANHKLFCHMPQQGSLTWHYVYLMKRQGLGWRVGVTNDLVTRLRLERSADQIFALRAFTSDAEARFYETLWSLKYGLPTVCFKSRNGVVIQGDLLERLYKEIPTDEHAEKLANDLHIDLRVPNFTLSSVVRGSARRAKIHIEMLHRTYRGKSHVSSSHTLMRQGKVAHLLYLQTSDTQIIHTLESKGFNLQPARIGKRLRIVSQDLAELGRIAKEIEMMTGATIEVSSKIAKKVHQTLSAHVLPAMNVHEGLFLPVVKGRELIYDQIISVERFVDEETVYDLEIDRTHNYIANGIAIHNSIYKFRGASLANILRFEEDFPEAKRVVLTKNYRSAQEILDRSHAFIQHNNPNRLEAAQERQLSKKLEASTAMTATVEHIHALTATEEVACVVERIVTLKQEEGTDWSDFAVLVRSNAAGMDFAAALERHKIPYQFLALSGLYTKTPVLDLLAYLRIIDHPFDSPSFYRVLTSALCRVNERSILELNRWANQKGKSLFEACEQVGSIPEVLVEDQSVIRRLLEQVIEFQQAARTRPVGELFVMVAKDSGYLEHLNRLSEQKKLDSFSYLQQFYKRLKNFERRHDHPVLHHFLAEFAHERDAGEEGSLSVDLESGPDVVRIMTVHAAKGLEFKHVFVVNLVAQRFPTNQKSDAIPLPEGLGTSPANDKDAHLEEERRLFYVAMTRAKQGLYFTSAQDYGGSRARKLSRFLSELGYDAPEAPREMIELFDEDRGPSTYNLSGEAGPGSAWQPTTFPLPKQFSFTQLAAFKTCPLQYKFAHVLKIPMMGKWTLSFGKTMHNTLQRFFTLWLERTGSAQSSLFDVTTSSVSSRAKLTVEPRDLEPSHGEIPVSLEELVEAYHACWQDDWFQNDDQREHYREQGLASLKQFYTQIPDSRPDPISIEQGFTMKFGDVVLKGRIDRIDRFEDGVEIIDYKTGSPKNELSKEDKEQLFLYQLAARDVLGLIPKKLTYHYLTDNSQVSFLGTDDQLLDLQESIVDRVQAIRSSKFDPTPGFHCQFCDFADICEFKQ